MPELVRALPIVEVYDGRVVCHVMVPTADGKGRWPARPVFLHSEFEHKQAPKVGDHLHVMDDDTMVHVPR